MDAPEIPAAGIGTLARRIGSRRTRILLGALLAGAFLLRVIPWLANLPLHHDEALYGTWARSIADGSDPWLLVPWVDKPPLVLYLLGLSMRAFGASEVALRVPGMIAGVLTVWATFGLARRAAGEGAISGVAWAAAVLMALSPFAILFAPTAFTDGWLTLFIVAAAWAALARRPGWAGVLLGLACASKQQGVMAAPLVVALVVAAHARPDRCLTPVRSALGAVGLAALGFAAVFGAVTYWDSLRWHNRPSYWDQSLQTYGGVVLAPLAEWPRRAMEWARLAGYWFGAWPVTVALLAIGAKPVRSRRPDRSIFLILLYVLGYLLVHLAFTFQPWDRYLLPVLPLVCVLCGRGLAGLWEAVRRPAVARWAAAVGATAALVGAAMLGVTASIPVGSDIGAYRGVAEAAQFLAAQPAGTTVYYDRIGWHLGYYLYGKPVTRSWYDSPQKLASEAARVAGEQAGAAGPQARQWLALPAWEEPQLPALEEALAVDGLAAVPAYEVVGRAGTVALRLYRLEPSGVPSEFLAGAVP